MTVYAVPEAPGLRVHVADLACCSVEVAAAVARGLLVPTQDESGSDPADDVAVLVVSGTVTDALAPAVLAAWESLPERRAVLAFGACSTSGGPYWDSYCVTKGIDQVIPVRSYVPGCPPRPEALVDAILSLVESA